MKMDLFEQWFKWEVKQIIAGYAYANFQEMYQKAVKVARIINKTDLRIEKKAKERKSLALEDPIIKETKAFEGLKLEWNRAKESTSLMERKENVWLVWASTPWPM